MNQCDSCKDRNTCNLKDIMNCSIYEFDGIQNRDDFYIDMIHNVEELSELQKEISKFARGKGDFSNIVTEIEHCMVAIKNLQLWMERYKKDED